VIQKYIE
jgi:hypothetical protein